MPPQSDAYEALSRVGTGQPLTGGSAARMGHADVTDYLTRTPPFLYNTLFFITMNLGKWNALPPKDLQEAILQVNEQIHEELACSLWDEQNRRALDWAINEKGGWN